MPEFDARERDVITLLRDLRPFETAFGGAMPLDETGVVDASYGPAGMILAGAAFRDAGLSGDDVVRLGRSLRRLRLALRVLRGEDFDAWASLINPYLGDPADAGIIGDWRRRIAQLDEENAAIRAHNELQRKNAKRGKDTSPLKDEKVRHVFMREQLGRHDRAVKKLARYLAKEELHPVNPRLMSVREEAAGDAANAQVYAYYQQVRVSGRTHQGAVSATALKFRISDAEVERIVEFRKDVKLATCAEEGCERGVFQQNMCVKHYNREYRSRKKRETS